MLPHRVSVCLPEALTVEFLRHHLVNIEIHAEYIEDGQQEFVIRGGRLSFQSHVEDNSSTMANTDLRVVAKGTVAVTAGLLQTRLDVGDEGKLLISSKIKADPKKCPKLPLTKVRVIDGDTIDTALKLEEQTKISQASKKQKSSSSSASSQQAAVSKPVLVLNMANKDTPGGGWLRGSKAQEEALCYRSTLWATLKLKYYKRKGGLAVDSGVYSPRVLVFRENMKNDSVFMDCSQPLLLPVYAAISVAAICRADRKKPLTDQEEIITAEKIRLILRASIAEGHQQIVLGALGCGAFANPPKEIAELFSSIFQEPEFSCGWWKDVVFAVMGGKGANDENFKVFTKILGGLAV